MACGGRQLRTAACGTWVRPVFAERVPESSLREALCALLRSQPRNKAYKKNRGRCCHWPKHPSHREALAEIAHGHGRGDHGFCVRVKRQKLVSPAKADLDTRVLGAKGCARRSTRTGIRGVIYKKTKKKRGVLQRPPEGDAKWWRTTQTASGLQTDECRLKRMNA